MTSSKHSPLKILIIDDEKIIRQSIKEMLQNDDYTILEAENGKEGLSKIKRENPILVITDLRMPIMSGISMLKKLKPKPDNPYSLIVLTGHGDNEDILTCYELGVSSFLKKPFNIFELKGSIKQNIALKQAQNNLKDKHNELVLHKEHLMELVKDRTKELELQNNTLQEINNQLKLSKESYKDLIEKAPTPIIIHDRSGFVFANRVALSIMGVNSVDGIIGKNPLDYFPEEDREEIIETYETCFNTQQATPLPHLVFVSENKSQHEFKGSAMPIKFNNKNAMLSIGIDITESKLMEEQIRQSQKMEAVGQLAGGIAHDFNNILTGILGYAELGIMSIDKPDTVQSYLESITLKSNEAAQLVHQMMVFSRKQKLTLEPVNLLSAISDFSRFIGKTIQSRIVLNQWQNEENSFIIEGDALAINQIFSNLIINAEHAMPNGGQISIDRKIVSLSKSDIGELQNVSAGDFIQISVSDTGTGIPNDIIDEIFNPFFTTKQVGEGTGLGLSMVFELMSQHGGFVTVKSEMNEGTTFYLNFPLSKSKYESQSLPEEKTTLKGKGSVLLVEDDLDILSILKALLNELGFKIRTAKDGKDALNLLLDGKVKIDLVISDIHMPKVDGLELFKTLEQNGLNIKFIFMSGNSGAKLNNQDERLKDIPFLQKPFTMQQATQTITNVLKN